MRINLFSMKTNRVTTLSRLPALALKSDRAGGFRHARTAHMKLTPYIDYGNYRTYSYHRLWVTRSLAVGAPLEFSHIRRVRDGDDQRLRR
jgi:hypothetical protein